MPDFESHDFDNLSQEDIFKLVRETMDEVGIAYQYAPGGIIFNRLNREDTICDIDVPEATPAEIAET